MPIPVPIPWWVLQPSVTARGQPAFVAVQSRTKPPDTAVSHVVAGPFATRAEAEAWIAKQTAGPSLPNPFAFLAWIQEIGHYIGLGIAYATDGPMWRSIGWILLGFIFLVSGVILWFMRTADVGSVAELGAALA